jgi:hypothetical protein
MLSNLRVVKSSRRGRFLAAGFRALNHGGTLSISSFFASTLSMAML